MNEIKMFYVSEVVDSISETHLYNAEKLFAINTSDVENGNLNIPELLPVEELKGQFKKTVKNNDILFSEVRPANRHFALVNVKNPERYVASTKLMVLRKKNDDVDIKYFYYWLTNNSFLRVLQRRAENRICSFPQITFELLSQYKIPVPSLEAQRKIVSVIDNIDKKIINNSKICREIESISKTIYDYWFIQFDFPDENGKPYKSNGGKMVWNDKLKREIPDGWEAKPISQCVEHINTGLNPRDNFVLGNGTIKYVTTKNLTQNGTIDFTGCDMIDESAKNTVHARSDIKVGDILMGSIAPIGRCYLIQREPTDWDINESVFSIRVKQNVIPSEYLYQYLRSEFFIKKAMNVSVGSIFKGIRIDTLNNELLLIPPNNILQQYKNAVCVMLKQQDLIEEENQQLVALREWLLPMLMNGQIGFKSEGSN